MATRKRIEHAVARAASRHVAPAHIDSALDAFAEHVKAKMPDLQGAWAGPRDQLIPKTEELAGAFFAEHAKQNPDVARAAPKVDVAVAARKQRLDWNS